MKNNRSSRKTGRRGHTAIEMAVLLALMLFVLFVAVTAVGLATRDSLGRMTLAANPHDQITTRSADTLPSQAKPHSLRDVIRNGLSQRSWQLIGLAASILLIVLLWALVIRRYQRILLPLDEVQELTPELDQNKVFERRQHLLRVLATNTASLFEGRLEVRHVMSLEPLTVTSHATIEEVKESLRASHAYVALVCDADQRLEGLILHGDTQRPNLRRAVEIMHRNPPTVAPDTSLVQALTLLLHERTLCLPVVRDGTLIGVLTATDAIMAWQSTLQFMERIGEQVKPVLEHRRGTSITEVAAKG